MYGLFKTKNQPIKSTDPNYTHPNYTQYTLKAKKMTGKNFTERINDTMINNKIFLVIGNTIYEGTLVKQGATYYLHNDEITIEITDEDDIFLNLNEIVKSKIEDRPYVEHENRIRKHE